MSRDGGLRVVPVHLAAVSAEETVASLTVAVRSVGDVGTTLVVEAGYVGPRVSPQERVSAVLRFGERVVAEWWGEARLTRIVELAGVALLDAGAVDLDDHTVGFPPQDPRVAAQQIATQTGAPAVVLASTRTPDGTPVVLATYGTAHEEDAAALTLTGAPAALVSGRDLPHPNVPSTTDGAPRGRHGAGSLFTEPLVYAASVRAALGVAPGTEEAIDVGLPVRKAAGAEPVEGRVARACRAALRNPSTPPPWHPAAARAGVPAPLAAVSYTTLQTGVRLDAPDDYTLGMAVARLVVALAAEGISAVPGRREPGPVGVVLFVDDGRAAAQP